MRAHHFAAAALFGWLAAYPYASLAEAGDYEFQAVEAAVQKGDGVILAVRLVHRPSGKAVPDAVVFRTRLDMAPDGMEAMTAPLEGRPAEEPGVYSFTTSLVMAGRWQLTLAAKIQGEPETVTGKVVFHAAD